MDLESVSHDKNEHEEKAGGGALRFYSLKECP